MSSHPERLLRLSERATPPDVAQHYVDAQAGARAFRPLQTRAGPILTVRTDDDGIRLRTNPMIPWRSITAAGYRRPAIGEKDGYLWLATAAQGPPRGLRVRPSPTVQVIHAATDPTAADLLADEVLRRTGLTGFHVRHLMSLGPVPMDKRAAQHDLHVLRGARAQATIARSTVDDVIREMIDSPARGAVSLSVVEYVTLMGTRATSLTTIEGTLGGQSHLLREHGREGEWTVGLSGPQSVDLESQTTAGPDEVVELDLGRVEVTSTEVRFVGRTQTRVSAHDDVLSIAEQGSTLTFTDRKRESPWSVRLPDPAALRRTLVSARCAAAILGALGAEAVFTHAQREDAVTEMSQSLNGVFAPLDAAADRLDQQIVWMGARA